MDATIGSAAAKNSGKPPRASYVRRHGPPADPLTDLPHDERIRSRKLAGGVATIIADVTGLTTGRARALERELRDAALAVPGVDEARIAMTAAQPQPDADRDRQRQGRRRQIDASPPISRSRWRAPGKKVGLIDADIYGPSQPTLLGNARASPTAEDDKLIPVEAHGVKFLSLGQLVSPGHALAWRGPMATGALAN